MHFTCHLPSSPSTQQSRPHVTHTREEVCVAQKAVALQALHKLPKAGAVQLLAAHGGIASVVGELHAVHLCQKHL